MQPDLIRFSSTNKNTSKSQKQNKESEPITAISNILATIDGQNQLQQVSFYLFSIKTTNELSNSIVHHF
jgi:hypothetical protein